MLTRPTQGPSGLFETNVNGKTYAITEWPIRIWMDRYILLMGTAGDFIARFMAAANYGRKVDESLIAELGTALFTNMGKDRKATSELIEALCSQQVFVDGKPVNFAIEFDKKPLLLHRVTMAALAVQYGPLFDEMRAEFDAANSTLASQETTSSEGSGPSSTPGSGAGSKSTSDGPSPTT